MNPLKIIVATVCIMIYTALLIYIFFNAGKSNATPKCPPCNPIIKTETKQIPVIDKRLLELSYRNGWVACQNSYTNFINASGGLENAETVNALLKKQRNIDSIAYHYFIGK